MTLGNIFPDGFCHRLYHHFCRWPLLALVVGWLGVATPGWGAVTFDVQFKSPGQAPHFITAQLSGSFANSCQAIEDVEYAFSENFEEPYAINIYLNLVAGGTFCREITEPFYQDVYLGALPEGIYTVRVFENSLPVFERELAVPDDVANYFLDFNPSGSFGNVLFERAPAGESSQQAEPLGIKRT